nr:MAG TPA: hypothetical protein [Caudoviricetes sp.]
MNGSRQREPGRVLLDWFFDMMEILGVLLHLTQKGFD